MYFRLLSFLSHLLRKEQDGVNVNLRLNLTVIGVRCGLLADSLSHGLQSSSNVTYSMEMSTTRKDTNCVAPAYMEPPTFITGFVLHSVNDTPTFT
jgi:hypothetical protein